MKIKGKVIKGKGAGKTLGYPTANLNCVVDLSGVFTCRVFVDDEYFNGVAVFKAKINPEVHLLDFDQNILGTILEVDVLGKISEVQKCKDQAALIRKIKEDIKKAKKYFSV